MHVKQLRGAARVETGERLVLQLVLLLVQTLLARDPGMELEKEHACAGL